jgi:hypothetical protein
LKGLASAYYGVIQFLSGLFPVALILGVFTINYWLDFDKFTPFEKRRVRMAKRLREILQPVEASDYSSNHTDRPLKQGEGELQTIDKDKLFTAYDYRDTEDRLKERE